MGQLIQTPAVFRFQGPEYVDKGADYEKGEIDLNYSRMGWFWVDGGSVNHSSVNHDVNLCQFIIQFTFIKLCLQLLLTTNVQTSTNDKRTNVIQLTLSFHF